MSNNGLTRLRRRTVSKCAMSLGGDAAVHGAVRGGLAGGAGGELGRAGRAHGAALRQAAAQRRERAARPQHRAPRHQKSVQHLRVSHASCFHFPFGPRKSRTHHPHVIIK